MRVFWLFLFAFREIFPELKWSLHSLIEGFKMQTVTIPQLKQDVKTATASKRLQNFPPLDQENRSHVHTSCAAFHLTRKAQTLRAWACLENGTLRPIRIMGRLAWATADIKRLLSVGV